MKITFYSNFLTHHQLPFCLEMYKKYGEDFKFVSMEKINQERISLGYKDMDNDYPFVLKAYESKEKYNEATKLAVDSDIVIAGSTPTDDYIKERLKQDKITFRYYARIFYNGVLSIFDFENSKKVYDRHLKYKKNKNLYLLCASSYGPNDFNELGMYKNKCFKWGYFPETKIYNVEDLLKQKENEKIEIIWVGRFIKEKHPEYVVKLAQKLKEKNIPLIILTTLPPCYYSAPHVDPIYRECRDIEKMEELNRIILSLNKDNPFVHVLDIFPIYADKNQSLRVEDTLDGIHLTPLAYQRMVEPLRQRILEVMKGQNV